MDKQVRFHGRLLHGLQGRLRLHYAGLGYLREECAGVLREICALYAIRSASANLVTETLLVEYCPEAKSMKDVKASIDYILQKYLLTAYKHMREQRAAGEETAAEEGQSSRGILRRLLVSGGTIALSRTLLKGWAERQLWSRPYIGSFTTFPALVALSLSVPLCKSALRGLVRDRQLNADFLTVVSIGASLLLGQSASALTILALSDCAEFLTAFTIERTRKSIKDLLSVDEDFAWKLLPGNELQRCPVQNIRVDDIVVFHAGEKIVVDGVVSEGHALVDQSHTTGEMLPVVKREGESVYAGAIVTTGAIRVRAVKIGDDTVVSRIVDMVENASSRKAPIQHYADQFSNYLVPVNFLAALVVGLITRSPDKALKMLVIDYSCGIKLSTATAFSAAIHNAVRRGILIKGGAYLEQMANANTVIFDKTGTITEGRPEIVQTRVLAKGIAEAELVALACAAEETSSHPLADAVLRYGEKLGVAIPLHGQNETVIAKGASAEVEGKVIRVGNLAYLAENKVRIPQKVKELPEEGMPVYVASNTRLLGVLYAVDKPRGNIRRAVNSLRGRGIDEIVLMTGDRFDHARTAAEQIGADRFIAEMTPEDKADALLRSQADGNTIIMVGDGINDAPALAYANVGISLGNKSTDVAMETSDVVIGQDDPMLIPGVMDLARKTMRIVKQNFVMVIGINTIGLLLGAASNISVFLSAALHNLSTIAVVGNSCRLLLASGKERDRDD